MKPIGVNGDVWQVNLVSPVDPSLIDRTGNLRLATTDPSTRTVNIANNLTPPLLDKVLLHEVAHVITVSHGLLLPLRAKISPELWVLVEEWSASLVENYGIEAAVLASQSLGRPICVRNNCIEV